MTQTFPVFTNENHTALSLRRREGFTVPAYLTHSRQTSDGDLAVSRPPNGTNQRFFVEAVCLDYEFVDGGFDLTLYATESDCLTDVGEADGAVEVYVDF